MSVNSESAPTRSFVRVERIAGGEHTWAVTVVAGDDTVGALREAVVIARDIEREMTITFDWRYDADRPVHDEETPTT